MHGKCELHPTKNHLRGGHSRIWMTASNSLFCFPVWPFPGTTLNRCTTKLPPGCLQIHNLRGTIILHAQSVGSPPRTNDRTRSQAMMTSEKTKNRHPGCQACAMIGVSSRVVANSRQSNQFSRHAYYTRGIKNRDVDNRRF